MPVRVRALPPDEVAPLLGRLEVARLVGEPDRDDIRAAVKHFLAVLAARAPGQSVEVRVPPYAVVQCIEGARHTRGTPPAVVETDADSWLDLALGRSTFAELSAAGSVRASGERSDLTSLLPLT
ncbi:MAG: hypothetical protein H0X54_08325 [Propionibacteriales bacterium]|jgi:hypothetical protein|nr:hypothetical protein [Propionibacteriales bacterium]